MCIEQRAAHTHAPARPVTTARACVPCVYEACSAALLRRRVWSCGTQCQHAAHNRVPAGHGTTRTHVADNAGYCVAQQVYRCACVVRRHIRATPMYSGGAAPCYIGRAYRCHVLRRRTCIHGTRRENVQCMHSTRRVNDAVLRLRLLARRSVRTRIVAAVSHRGGSRSGALRRRCCAADGLWTSRRWWATLRHRRLRRANTLRRRRRAAGLDYLRRTARSLSCGWAARRLDRSARLRTTGLIVVLAHCCACIHT